MIDSTIKEALLERLKTLEVNDSEIILEVPNDPENGDFSTNIAMQLASKLRNAPRKIAEMIIKDLSIDGIKTIEIAGPGFINFYVDKAIYQDVIYTINAQQSKYGQLSIGENERVNIEYVSANPTGSLHIGHARGAAAGDAYHRILTKAGYNVTREFYVNDGGNQIHNLTQSIDARYRQLFDDTVTMPEDGYHGKEIINLAKNIKKEHNDRFLKEDSYAFFKTYGVEFLLNALKVDLEAFNVHFDVWFHESSLYEEDKINDTINKLKAGNYVYEKDGALWLKSSDYGDEKDRVIIKSDGSYTYLLPDVAYHHNKLSRGFTHLIDILGSDHHGYVARLKAAISMIGGRSDLLDVDLLQMVKVMRDGEEVKMSKRSGKTITLKDLIEEVDAGPIRYFFAMRSLNTQMELDLDLALKTTNENPFYYSQYAHARIVSVLNQADKKGFKPDLSLKTFSTLNHEKIDDILTILVDYPRVIEEAATKRLPHKITHYIQQLAQALHSFYAAEMIISDDNRATTERLTLLSAVKTVLSDALNLIGVDAKDSM